MTSLLAINWVEKVSLQEVAPLELHEISSYINLASVRSLFGLVITHSNCKHQMHKESILKSNPIKLTNQRLNCFPFPLFTNTNETER